MENNSILLQEIKKNHRNGELNRQLQKFGF